MSTSLLYHEFGIRGYQHVRTDRGEGATVFLMRKNDGEPGRITLWRGTVKLLDAIRGHLAMLKRCG